jgi:hypothetical protein
MPFDAGAKARLFIIIQQKSETLVSRMRVDQALFSSSFEAFKIGVSVSLTEEQT